MKTNLLLLMLMIISITSYSQTGMNNFTAYDTSMSWVEFKNKNEVINIQQKSPTVVTMELNGSNIDSDYKLITYVFISNRLMNCVVEFNNKQTVKSLSLKYGHGNETPSGYEWLSKDGVVHILYDKSMPYEVMILFRNKQYVYTPTNR